MAGEKLFSFGVTLRHFVTFLMMITFAPQEDIVNCTEHQCADDSGGVVCQQSDVPATAGTGNCRSSICKQTLKAQIDDAN